MADREENDTQALTIRLPVDEHDALRTFAFVTDSTMNDVVRRAILNFLANEGRTDEMKAIIDRVRKTQRLALDKLADM